MTLIAANRQGRFVLMSSLVSLLPTFMPPPRASLRRFASGPLLAKTVAC